MRGSARVTAFQQINEQMYTAMMHCRVYVDFHWNSDVKYRGGHARGNSRCGYRRDLSFRAYYFKSLDKEEYYLFEEEFIARNITFTPSISVARKEHSTEAHLVEALHEQLPFLLNVPYTIAYCENKRINRAGVIFCTPKNIHINVQTINELKYKLTLLMAD